MQSQTQLTGIRYNDLTVIERIMLKSLIPKTYVCIYLKYNAQITNGLLNKIR